MKNLSISFKSRNMKRKIFISHLAAQDIAKVVRYIRLDKPAAAEKFKKILKNKIRALVRFSFLGRQIPELKGTEYQDYRELIIRPCRVLYKREKDSIRILRVLHSRMRFSL